MKNRKGICLLLLALIGVTAMLWQNIYRERYLKFVYPVKYADLVTSYSKQYNLDPWLVFAVIKNESGFNPQAKSSIGALGLMQLTPETFDWAQSKTTETENFQDNDLYTPDVNIRYGTIVLSSLLNEFGNTETALAAYHAGRTNAKKWLADSRYSSDGKTLDTIPFDNTRAYVKKVVKTRQIYADLYAPKTKSQ